MSNNPLVGTQQLSTLGADFNSLRYIVMQILANIRTSTPCKVIAITNAGTVSPVGYVDLQPLVNQVTGAGVGQAQGVIHHIPYVRLQGGTNAIIIDPQVGDIGVVYACDSDISNVIATYARANPGSAREYDISDSIYINGISSGTPVQYIQFNADGVTIFSPNDIVVQATGDVTAIAGGDIVATAGGSITATAGTTASITATDSITAMAPTINLEGNTVITGNLSYTGSGTNAGTPVDATHEHDVVAVQSGGSTITTTPPL